MVQLSTFIKCISNCINFKKNGKSSNEFFLGIGEDHSNDIRNPFLGSIYYDDNYNDDIYIIPNITKEKINKNSFKSILTGGHINSIPFFFSISNNSKILIYLTGHGGSGFLKFGPNEELNIEEFSLILLEMKRIYNFFELLIIIDTCQAESFFNLINIPGITIIVSSSINEYSTSSIYDKLYGIPLTDLFTYYFCLILKQSNYFTNLLEIFNKLKNYNIGSNPKIFQTNFTRNLKEIIIYNYFY